MSVRHVAREGTHDAQMCEGAGDINSHFLKTLFLVKKSPHQGPGDTAQQLRARASLQGTQSNSLIHMEANNCQKLPLERVQGLLTSHSPHACCAHLYTQAKTAIHIK